MSDNRNEPKEYDAVLGGQNLIPVNAAILGGIAGVKSRLASSTVETRIAALSEALKYGEVGLCLIVQALQDESMQVQIAACSLLKEIGCDRDLISVNIDIPRIRKVLKTSDCRFNFDVITVDKQGRENSRTKSFAFYFSEELGSSIVLEMVYIPSGTFLMGSPSEELPYDGGILNQESPQHQVTVPTFFAGKYPITQAQWQTVMGNNPSQFKGNKRPVECVSWYDAVEFCQKLSEKTGRAYRLLSEAEWEYACRAGTTTRFYFGYTITPDLVSNNQCERYDHTRSKRQETTDVGIFPPNVFGLYDMHGNVREWCSDKKVETASYGYKDAPTDGSSWETHNPYAKDTADRDDYRIHRGGAFSSTLRDCRSASRGYLPANTSNWPSGFRVAVASVFPPS